MILYPLIFLFYYFILAFDKGIIFSLLYNVVCILVIRNLVCRNSLINKKINNIYRNLKLFKKNTKPISQTRSALYIFLIHFVATIVAYVNLYFLSNRVVLLLLSLYIALYLSLRLFFVYIFYKNKWNLILISLSYILLDLITSYSNFLFPLYPSQSIYKYNFINPLLKLFHPVSFDIILFLISYYIVSLIEKDFKKKELFLFPAIVLFLVGFSCLFKYTYTSRYNKKNISLKIGYVQKSVPLVHYMFANYYPIFYERIADNYLSSFGPSSVLKESDLIVLPESSIPMYDGINSRSFNMLKNYSQLNNTDILIHVFIKPNNSQKQNSYAVLIKPDGQIQKYEKSNYVPVMESELFDGGKSKEHLESSNGIRIRPSICFDSVFIKNYFDKSNSNDLYVVMSNDAFADGTRLSEWHELYSIMYSKFLKIPLIHISQSNHSFVVNTNGELKYLTNQSEKKIGVESLEI